MSEFEKNVTRGRFLLEKRTKFNLQGGSKIASCAHTSEVLVLSQTNGVFSVYNVDTLTAIHSFQIAQNKIDSICVNSTGEWIAMGSRELG
jgi:periodic tryptophan protein 2